VSFFECSLPLHISHTLTAWAGGGGAREEINRLKCYGNPLLKFYLKVHLHEIFFVLVFCDYRTQIGQIIRLLNVFDFVLEFADLFKFFNIRR
jgi:hypothetical protein